MPTAVVKQRDFRTVAVAWWVCHVAGHAATTALGMAAAAALHEAAARSRHRCYLYNAMLMVHERSRDAYRSQTPDRFVWYRSEHCYGQLEFALRVSAVSAVWAAVHGTFGRGGTVPLELNETKFFGIMVEQWRVVLWAGICNCWYYVRSLTMAVLFTDGYWKFTQTVLRVPADDEYRKEFETSAQPLYILTLVLIWLVHVSCTFNLAVTVGRLVTGVDFEIVHVDAPPENVTAGEDVDDDSPSSSHGLPT